MKEIDIDFDKLKKETGYDFLKNGEKQIIDFCDEKWKEFLWECEI